MARRPVENLSSPGIERGLRLVIWDGQCTQVMMVMTGGVFLVDFALRLGASGLAIGLISAVPALANLAQLPSIALVERLRYRRSLAVATSGASRLLFVGLAALPFFALSGPLAITAVVTTLAAVYGLGAVSYCAWSSWMRDLVPADRLGAVFARRMMLMAGLGAILGPLAGAYVEWFRAGWPGLTPFTYVPIFALGAIFGLIGVWVLAITPEPAMPAPAGGRGFGARVAAPLRDRNYRAILLFNVAWNAAANLAAPFFAVYMLKRIGLEVGLITVLSAAFQLANLAAFGAWGRIADRHASRAVLGVSVPVFMLGIPCFVLAAAAPGLASAFAMLLALHIGIGFAHAGVALAGSTMALKLAPPGEATAYLAMNNLAANLAGGIAPLLGGWIADRLAGTAVPVTFFGMTPILALGGWDMLFLIASLAGLGAIAAERTLREAGSIGRRATLNAFITEFRTDLRAWGRALRRGRSGT